MSKLKPARRQALLRRIDAVESKIIETQFALDEAGVGKRWRKYCAEKTADLLAGFRQTVDDA